MIDLKNFKENAIARGLCQEYTSMWNDEKSKRQLFELACDSNSVSYMTKALFEGWGLSPEYIADKFKSYINGKYICKYKNDKDNGYTSTMLCKYEEESFFVDTTLLCILESCTTIKIKPYHICKIYISGDSKINVELGENSRCYIYIYGGETLLTGDIINNRVSIERIMEKEKDG